MCIGIEPENTSSLSLELSDTVRARREELVSAVLEEISRAGAGYYTRAPRSLIGASGRHPYNQKTTAVL